MELITREDAHGVARLTLNNPTKLNPLSTAALEALLAHCRNLKADKNIRAVILASTGKAFSAGHDLKEMQGVRQAEDGGQTGFEALFKLCAKAMLALRDLPQPVIAEVQGIAAAAGCQLAASCDMVMAAEGVKFGVNGVNIGLFCSTPMVALSRKIGSNKAMEMLTTGRFMDAVEAERAGLVNHVVPADQLTARTAEMASTIAGKLASAVALGKPAFYHQQDMGLDAAYVFTGAVMVENMMDGDTAEGIAAFLEKRLPDWPKK